MKKFDKGLLVAILVAVAVIAASLLLPNKSYGAPVWVEKPVQCATYAEVITRAAGEGMKPLFTMVGNVRIEEETYSLPIVFYYNYESTYWMMVEVHTDDTACVAGVGAEVDFDVSEFYEDTKQERSW